MKSTVAKRSIRGFLMCLLLCGVSHKVFGGLENQIWIADSNGVPRYYDLYTPDSQGSQPWPLVIDLHGYGLTPRDQRRASALGALAESQNFAVA